MRGPKRFSDKVRLEAGYMAAVPPILERLYHVLDAFVYRGDAVPGEPLTECYVGGHVVCFMSHAKMAEMMDVAECEIAGLLEALECMGFIEKGEMPDRVGTAYYTLGQVVFLMSGVVASEGAEILDREQVIVCVISEANRRVKERGLKSVTGLSIEERVAIWKARMMPRSKWQALEDCWGHLQLAQPHGG